MPAIARTIATVLGMLVLSTSVFLRAGGAYPGAPEPYTIDTYNRQSLAAGEGRIASVLSCEVRALVIYYAFGQITLISHQRNHNCEIEAAVLGELTESGEPALYYCNADQLQTIECLRKDGAVRDSPPRLRERCGIDGPAP